MALIPCPDGNLIATATTDRPATPGTIAGGTILFETPTGNVWVALQPANTWMLVQAGGGTGASFQARVVATSNVDITTGLVAGQTINGVALAAGDRVLLAQQTAPAQNGLYAVTSAGAATFAPEWATGVVRTGTTVTVGPAGSGAGSFPNSEWRVTATPVASTTGAIVVGTTDPLLYPRVHTIQTTLAAGAGAPATLYILSASATTGSGAGITVNSLGANPARWNTPVAGRGNGSLVLAGTGVEVVQTTIVNW